MNSSSFSFNGQASPEQSEQIENAVKSVCGEIDAMTALLYTNPVVIICHSVEPLNQVSITNIQGALDNLVLE